MNKKPRRSYRGQALALTEDQELFLLHSFCLDGFQPDYGHPRTTRMWSVPFKDEDEMIRAWLDNSETLLAKVKPGWEAWALCFD